MHRGYIKLWRRIVDWGWYVDSHTLHLFLHLLIHANHRDGEFKGVRISRGQIVVGLLQLNNKTGISVRSLRTSLEHLEQTGEITRKSTNKFSIITLCNYESYQSDELEIDKQPTNNRQTTDKQPTTILELKNEKNNTNTIFSDEINAIYALYPPTDLNNDGRSTGKGAKDKVKIRVLLKTMTVGDIEERIRNYLENCRQSKCYLKNFSVFLNNLPEPIKVPQPIKRTWVPQ